MVISWFKDVTLMSSIGEAWPELILKTSVMLGTSILPICAPTTKKRHSSPGSIITRLALEVFWIYVVPLMSSLSRSKHMIVTIDSCPGSIGPVGSCTITRMYSTKTSCVMSAF